MTMMLCPFIAEANKTLIAKMTKYWRQRGIVESSALATVWC
jgi:hypothetical protein